MMNTGRYYATSHNNGIYRLGFYSVEVDFYPKVECWTFFHFYFIKNEEIEVPVGLSRRYNTMNVNARQRIFKQTMRFYFPMEFFWCYVFVRKCDFYVGEFYGTFLLMLLQWFPIDPLKKKNAVGGVL